MHFFLLKEGMDAGVFLVDNTGGTIFPQDSGKSVSSLSVTRDRGRGLNAKDLCDVKSPDGYCQR